MIKKISIFALLALGLATVFFINTTNANGQVVGVQQSVQRDLALGSYGSDVAALQVFLESRGYMYVPVGVAHGYFGVLTQSGVARFQQANGIYPANGYFSAQTRAVYNSQLGYTGYPTTYPQYPQNTSGLTCPPDYTLTVLNNRPICAKPFTTTSSSNNNNNSNDNEDLNGGDISLDNFDVKEGNDTDLEEDDSNAEVMDIKFDVQDGDARLQRADVDFEYTGNSDGEDKPWNVFDRARLMSDGDEIASIDASDEDEWSEQNNDVYRLRFDNLDEIIREDDRADLTLVLDVARNVDGSDNGDVSYDIYIPDEGIRATDSNGNQEEIGDDSDTVSVTIDNNGSNSNNNSDDRLTISDSDSNPSKKTFNVYQDETSDWQTIFAFDLEAKNDDIEVTDLPITVELSDNNFSDVIDSAQLIVDGETYSNVSITHSDSDQATLTFHFDHRDVVINEGDTVTAKLRVRFARADNNYEDGEHVQAYLDSSNVEDIEAEGEDTLDSDQLRGNAEGKVHTLNVR